MSPSTIRERVRGIQNGDLTPVPTRDAATVVLLRDRPAGDGVEAYLLRRTSTMAFAAGMYVFPGGSVDPADARTEVGWVGPPAEEFAGPLHAEPSLARALVCAAVRETFEESGVLLAGDSGASVVDVSDPAWDEERRALEAREHHLASMLARRGLLVRADLLRPWAHWVTPEVEARRFDTRFFVAAMPTGQVTLEVGGEADRTLWMRPAEAVERHEGGTMTMLPPTIAVLRELCGFTTVADVIAATVGREVSTVMPRLRLVADDKLLFLMPGEQGYDG
jgi:8-oxo-dGTP pyrophosphatase MutT (NUDIX family)